MELISRQAAIKAIDNLPNCYNGYSDTYDKAYIIGVLEELPSVQPELLADKEQRIFLAAMEREEKICEEVDRNYVREPYEDSLMRVCREIRRKVKGALWT